MRTICIALTSAALLLPPAAAQAQQANPAHNWSGFYLGLNAGAAFGKFHTKTQVGAGNYFVFPADAATVSATGTRSLSDSGFTGGVQAGFNWQASNIVYGLEVDFGSFNIGAARQTTATFPVWGPSTYTLTNSADTDWLFTARGRYGWAFSNVLAYATGGLAVTRIRTANSYLDDAFFVPHTSGDWRASATKLGWTLGGGLEWALSSNWTVKAEYLYLDFGSVNAPGMIVDDASGSQAISTSVDLTAHITRAGINFKF
jgi:outer membrane immunogenic protein